MENIDILYPENNHLCKNNYMYYLNNTLVILVKQDLPSFLKN